MVEETKTISGLRPPIRVEFVDDPDAPTFDELLERERAKMFVPSGDDEGESEQPA